MTALLILAAIAAAVIALFLIPGSTPRIDARLHPHGLASLEQVPVNETRQWVLIRTEDVTNPVVLFVHGGPGTSQLTLMRRGTKPLERHFTVVNWDQRLAGKSFAAGADRSGIKVERFVEDVIALSSYLATRFRQERILLVGQSWGSGIGMLAVARRPDLFAGYVGIGQVSNEIESERLSYEWTLEQARAARHDSAVGKLTAMGPPPFTKRSDFMTQRMILGAHGGEYFASRRGAFGVVFKNVLLSREYTMLDRINFFRGIFQSVDILLPELYRIDLFIQVPEVKVPVWFCLGRHDFEVPSALSAKYFEFLKAPRKQLVWFENSAHLVATEENEKFNRFLIGVVLPALRAPAEQSSPPLVEALPRFEAPPTP